MLHTDCHIWLLSTDSHPRLECTSTMLDTKPTLPYIAIFDKMCKHNGWIRNQSFHTFQCLIRCSDGQNSHGWLWNTILSESFCQMLRSIWSSVSEDIAAQCSHILCLYYWKQCETGSQSEIEIWKGTSLIDPLEKASKASDYQKVEQYS